jgi:hypothetical protein
MLHSLLVELLIYLFAYYQDKFHVPVNNQVTWLNLGVRIEQYLILQQVVHLLYVLVVHVRWEAKRGDQEGVKTHPQFGFSCSQSERRKTKVADQQMSATLINAQFFSLVLLLTLLKLQSLRYAFLKLPSYLCATKWLQITMAGAYTNQINEGMLPRRPVGNVATALNNDLLDDQCTAATAFYTFLTNPDRELLQLNIGSGDKPCTFLINLSNSSKVRVGHCIGVGVSAIGATFPVDGKLLVLASDGGHDIGAPAPLVLPKSMVVANDIIAMTHDLFVARLAKKGWDYTWPLASHAKATENNTTTYHIMAIAPILIFLVNDGIDADLDTALVYERILGLSSYHKTNWWMDSFFPSWMKQVSKKYLFFLFLPRTTYNILCLPYVWMYLVMMMFQCVFSISEIRPPFDYFGKSKKLRINGTNFKKWNQF